MTRLLVAGCVLAALTPLAACGGGDATTTTTSARASTSASASPSPSATAADPKGTQPTGTYAWRDRITSVTPRNAAYTKAPATGTWRFTSTGCDTQACRGQIRSSRGGRFTYTWDGAALTVTRPALTQASYCTDAGGRRVPGSSVSVRSRFSYAAARPAVDGAAPQRIVLLTTQRIDYLHRVRCSGLGGAITRATDRLVLTKQG